VYAREERQRKRRAEAEATAPELTGVLALQRSAGNAAVAAYLQRATVGWPDGIAINKGPKPSGGFTRFPIGDMSVGLPQSKDNDDFEHAKGGWMSATAHTSEKPYMRGVVLVPTSLEKTPPAEIDVLFHLHGWGIGWREGTADADGSKAPVGFAYKGKVRDEAADAIAGQLPPTMAAVLPQGHRKAGFGGVDAPTMIDEALHSVPGWDKVRPRRVVLGAYSGGGGSLPDVLGSKEKDRDDRIADRQKAVPGLSEVVLFDAINGPNERRNMVNFVNDQIDADIAALTALAPDEPKQKTYLQSSMRLRAYYSKDSEDYGKYYPELFQQTVLAKKLWGGSPEKPTVGKTPTSKISQDVWELLAANYVIAPKGQGHPTKVGGGNLAEAMKGLPAGTTPTYPARPAPAPATP
jgi:hypothetical protein